MVIGFGKTKIILQCHELYLRKQWLQVFQAAIGGSIVYHQYLRAKSLNSTMHRMQALLQKVAHIIIHDDDGNLQKRWIETAN